MKRRLAAIAGAFDAQDIPVALFIFGLALLGYGLSRFHDGLGLTVVGLFIVLYVRPISRMLR